MVCLLSTGMFECVRGGGDVRGRVAMGRRKRQQRQPQAMAHPPDREDGLDRDRVGLHAQEFEDGLQPRVQLAGVVASPITGLVRGLGSMIQGLAVQLGQIAEKGLVSGKTSDQDSNEEEG